MDSNRLSPKDPKFIETILHEVKSQGLFDQFRKQCLEDVDTRPAYQNLRQRVENSVTKFLNQQHWTPELNRNQLRERLRRHIVDSGFLESGVERIVDQVVNPKISTVFQPKVEEIVYKYLGIEKPKLEIEVDTGNDDLLPEDLEAVSPDSDKKSPDLPIEDPVEIPEEENDSKEHIEDFESPPFEPLEIKRPISTTPPLPPPSPPKDEEKSDDSSDNSKISGLTSQSSIDSVKEEKEVIEEVVIEQEIVGEVVAVEEDEEEGEVKDSPIPPEASIEISQNESQLSQVSSNSRLSIITNNNSEDNRNTPRLDITEEAQMPKFNENSNSVECSAAKNEEEPQKSNFDLKKEEYEFKGTERKMPPMTADEMEIDTSKDDTEVNTVNAESIDKIPQTKIPIAEEVKVAEVAALDENLIVQAQVESSSHSEHSLRIYEESLTESKGTEPIAASTTEMTKVEENSSNSKSKDEKDKEKDRHKKSDREKDHEKHKERKKSSSSSRHHHSSSSKDRSSLTKDDHSKNSNSRDRDKDRSHHKRSHSHSSGHHHHHHHHHSDHRRSSKSKKDEKDDKKKSDERCNSHEKSTRKRRSTDHDSNDGANNGGAEMGKADEKKANREIPASTGNEKSPDGQKPSNEKQSGGQADTSADLNDTAEPLFEGFEESPLKREALELAKKPKGPALSTYMSNNRTLSSHHHKKKGLKNGQKATSPPQHKIEESPNLDVFSFSFEKPLKLDKNGEIIPEPEPEPEPEPSSAGETEVVMPIDEFKASAEENAEVAEEIVSLEDSATIESAENGPISVEQILTNGDNIDLEQLIVQNQIEDSETRQKIQETIQAVQKIKKPKIASNFQEARRLMKVRKQMDKEEQKLKEKAIVLAKKYITEHKPESDNQGVELEFACENKTAKPTISSPLRKKPKSTDEEVDDLLYLPEIKETFKQDESILDYLRKQVENYSDDVEMVEIDVQIFTLGSLVKDTKRKLTMEQDDKMKTMDELFRENNKLNFLDNTKSGKRVRKPNNRYASIDYDFQGGKEGDKVPDKTMKIDHEEDGNKNEAFNAISEIETTVEKQSSVAAAKNSITLRKRATPSKTKSKSNNATPGEDKFGIDARFKNMTPHNNNNSISKQKYESDDLYKPRSKTREKFRN